MRCGRDNLLEKIRPVKLKGVFKILIRKAGIGDATDIAKVQVDSWRTTYKGIVPDPFLNNLSYEQQRTDLEKGIMENNVYIAENENGQVIGFSAGGKERTGKYKTYLGELYAIYILKKYQGNRAWAITGSNCCG